MNYPLLQLVEVTRERITTWILDSNSNLRGSSFPINYLYLVKSCPAEVVLVGPNTWT